MSRRDIAPRERDVAAARPVKSAMGHLLAAFDIKRLWAPAFDLQKENAGLTARDAYGDLFVLRDRREPWANDQGKVYDRALGLLALLPSTTDLTREIDARLELMKSPPDEMTVRLLLGMLLDGWAQRPGEGASVRLDALAWSLEDLEESKDSGYGAYGVPSHVPAPAIAAAIKEAWQAFKFPPSIHEFAELCRKHRIRFARVIWELQSLRSFVESIKEVRWRLEPQPESGNPDDEIPF
jgi:hypothetical protein